MALTEYGNSQYLVGLGQANAPAPGGMPKLPSLDQQLSLALQTLAMCHKMLDSIGHEIDRPSSAQPEPQGILQQGAAIAALSADLSGRIGRLVEQLGHL